MNEIAQLISTVGFPIVMCLILFWYMTKQEERHESESNSMKDAINELRIAIVKLCEKLTKGDRENAD